ncbi:helix-turn-helix domain-containing protein [Frigidibacter sp. RF13]|uniref:helix-turn-helix domain-containing protein n=1 Tax=Frigidibacter sp. RF13 TaxID=2997340 RepID=UPI0022709C31|nr:helix-turn-helix domain-containing protein [Frigidibacter sp. RF13]MCY1125662.1 helix-turn-helix domain-containing protein [Frigidibacter sp. RF13]
MRRALTGTRIRERRMLLGLTQADCARRAGMSPAYLNLIEHNRRPVGPDLLERLAATLGVDTALLAEGAEGALFQTLTEAAAGVEPTAVPPETARIEEFVSRFPGWAALLAERQGRALSLTRRIEILSERMAQDPFLSASLHEVLSAITAIRSTSAILAEDADLDPDWRARFHRNIHADSIRLTEVSTALAAWLDQAHAPEAGLAAPQEEVEAWLASRGWDLPELGKDAHDIAPDLASEAARHMADQLIARHRSDLQLLPDAAFAPIHAVTSDPFEIATRLGLAPSLVLRRLALLPSAPGDTGSPAFPEGAAAVACDASGTLTFRRPCAGFALPRFGAACALWPLYEALSHPFAPVTALLRTSGRGSGGLFHAYAWAERSYPAGLAAAPVTEAWMFLVPARAKTGAARAVGSSCRVCAEAICPARREPSIISA